MYVCHFRNYLKLIFILFSLVSQKRYPVWGYVIVLGKRIGWVNKSFVGSIIVFYCYRDKKIFGWPGKKNWRKLDSKFLSFKVNSF